MPILVHLRQLDKGEVLLQGELSPEELDLQLSNEVMRVKGALQFDLTADHLEAGVLVGGELRLCLEADCVRCLKTFTLEFRKDDWQCLLPLEGEDSVPIVDDSVDLTPWVREDILLELPQHPLCDTRCGGFLQAPATQADSPGGSTLGESSSAWDALNKLNL